MDTGAFMDRIGVDIGRKLRLEEAVDWAIRNRIRHTDLCLDSDPEMLRGENGAGARAAAARRRMREAGVVLGLHTLSAVNVAETSPFLDAAADAYLAAYVAAARALGAGWIVVHAGYHFTADKPARLEAAIARLDRAAALAERAGATLLLENMNREPDDAEVHYLGHDLEECRALFGRLRSPALRWSCTVNHAHLLPGVGIEGFLDAMDLARRGKVRLADCRGTVEEHLRPDEGTIDFPRMFALLEGRGWRGHYMRAFGTLEDMLAGRETLARMAAQDLAAAGRR